VGGQAEFIWLIEHKKDQIMRHLRCFNLHFAVVFLASAMTSSAGTLIDVAFTSALVTSKTGFAATGVTTNDFWNTYNLSTGNLTNLKFVDGTPSGTSLTVLNANYATGNGASDPMYGVYLYHFPENGNVTVTVANLMPGAYDFYLYGHGSQNYFPGVYQISVGLQNIGSEETTNGAGWNSLVWQEGVQYVEFSNVLVNVGQTITITAVDADYYALISGLQMAFVSPLPSNAYITVQPEDRAATLGSIAGFSVVANGVNPLAYQWLFNSSNISGATTSTYSVTNAQPANGGSYSVIVTNAYGSVTSAVATLTIIQSLIDVAVTSSLVTGKTGFAATGLTSNDFWNTYDVNSGALSNLKFADGTASGVGLNISGVYGVDENGANDPMYGTYSWVYGYNIPVTITNLNAGSYDFLVYGHGNANEQNGVFQLSVGSQSYGSEATSIGSDWFSSTWQEGAQYVEFTNVGVSAGETVTITAGQGASGYAVICGLQLTDQGAMSSSFIISQPTNRAVALGETATLSVIAGGTPPLAYQWQVNNADIPGATNSSLIVTNAQPTNAGNYLVIVSNQYGSVSSLTVALNVIVAPVTNVIDVAFTAGSLTAERGFAATGASTNDFWNTCILNANTYYGSLANLEFEDGTASSAGLTVYNPVGANTDAASDPMYATYLFSDYDHSYPYIAVTVTNLIGGMYDFYLYGHGNADNENSVFQLTVGLVSYGSEATTNGPGWLSSVWQEGVQYVEFPYVTVFFGQTITITVTPGGSVYAVLSGLQMALILTSNDPPLIVGASNQFVNVNHEVIITNYAYSLNGPISFTLASNAPTGASITTNGIFTWVPACEQGSTTNLITVWVKDSSIPPLSNSMTFSMIVGECVEVSVGSNVVQAGQSTCVPVSLVSTVGLTNLSFTLAYASGFLTNWNVTPSNSVVDSAGANTVDPSHTQFNFGVQSGQVLRGTAVLGSICLDTLPGASAFVPLTVTNIGAVVSNNSPATNFIGQMGRVVVIGSQSLLEASLGTNSSRTLTLYGNSGVNYDLLSTTNLTDRSSWSTLGSVTLTDLFEVISLGSATNQMQFFKAVQQ
jgi:hypothetical protein